MFTRRTFFSSVPETELVETQSLFRLLGLRNPSSGSVILSTSSELPFSSRGRSWSLLPVSLALCCFLFWFLLSAAVCWFLMTTTTTITTTTSTFTVTPTTPTATAATTTTTTNPGTAALSPRAILPLGHGRCPGRVQNFSEAGKQQRRRPNLELALEG